MTTIGEAWPETAKSIRDAAKVTGYSRSALQSWKRKACPAFSNEVETVNLHVLRDWLEERGLGESSNVDLAQLRAEKLREEIEGAKLRNAALRGDSLPRSEMESFVATLAQKWDLLLRQKLEVELGARCVGKSAAEINTEGALILDEIRAVCEAGLNAWKAPADADRD